MDVPTPPPKAGAAASEGATAGTDASAHALTLYPVTTAIDKIVLYATKHRYYVVGSNQSESCYRVLKIDRSSPTELVITDDQHVYTKPQIHQMLVMIDEGNKSFGGLSKVIAAFGIFGFVRFIERYYIVVITKRRRVALIGAHKIYKVEDTEMLPVPHSSVKVQASPHEQRYLKLFQNVDLSSNFYYSYTYDLTHSLQYGMVMYTRFLAQKRAEGYAEPGAEPYELPPPNGMFVWNDYLLKGFRGEVHASWVLHVMHGFFSQANISVYGKSLYLALLCRRSRLHAGTRFLKRGANDKGHVANDVETEQILSHAGTLAHNTGAFTSFMQMRGSIPLYWSQDNSGMAPKPPITLDRVDPFAEAAALHFNHVMRRYGTPVVILNLVKRKEKRPRESILYEEFTSTVQYLNQFLPAEHKLRYIAFDMAKCAHSKDIKDNVIERLASIAEGVVKSTGFFHSGRQLRVIAQRPAAEVPAAGGVPYATAGMGRLQSGIVRVNCIDCLDRTNAVEFMVGKCALAHQLFAIGVLGHPSLDFDSDAVRLLEEMYEDHGDTIALQYGGSQLVNTMETYRKISPWTSHSRDILHTIHRYYSNSFTDTEKQDAINVFLGVYRPLEARANLWELATDYYLHNFDPACGLPGVHHYPYVDWVDNSLPNRAEKGRPRLTHAEGCSDVYFRDQAPPLPGRGLARVRGSGGKSFEDHYQPKALTSFRELFSHNMTSTMRLVRAANEDPSPFRVRSRVPAPQTPSGLPTFNVGVKRWLNLGQASATDQAASQYLKVADDAPSDDDGTSDYDELSTLYSEPDGYVDVASRSQAGGTKNPLKRQWLFHKQHSQRTIELGATNGAAAAAALAAAAAASAAADARSGRPRDVSLLRHESSMTYGVFMLEPSVDPLDEYVHFIPDVIERGAIEMGDERAKPHRVSASFPRPTDVVPKANEQIYREHIARSDPFKRAKLSNDEKAFYKKYITASSLLSALDATKESY